MSASAPAIGKNLCGGGWSDAASTHDIYDPMNGEAFIKVPDTQLSEIEPFVQRMLDCPRTGLHNPFKNPERYIMLGRVCADAAEEMKKPEVAEFFGKMIQRLTPKSWLPTTVVTASARSCCACAT